MIKNLKVKSDHDKTRKQFCIAIEASEKSRIVMTMLRKTDDLKNLITNHDIAKCFRYPKYMG